MKKLLIAAIAAFTMSCHSKVEIKVEDQDSTMVDSVDIDTLTVLDSVYDTTLGGKHD